MKTVTIYGASDDLIEIKGDIKGEISASDEANTKLAFSDGTVLSVFYDKDGNWRVNRLKAGSSEMSKVESEGPDTENYSDRVTLSGDIEWVVAGEFMKTVKAS